MATRVVRETQLYGFSKTLSNLQTAIQAPAHTPQVHPHDRALLRPLSTLGKPKVSESAVSFLRRTEYISSAASKSHKDSGALRSLNNNTLKRPLKRKSPEPEAGSPAFIKRKIAKSFHAGEQYARNPRQIKNPTPAKRAKGIKVKEAYPLLPDLDAFPDSGAYVTIRFQHGPVSASDTYDGRLLSGIFKPIEKSEAEEKAYDLALQAWEADPTGPRPANLMNYDYYLADTARSAANFRTKFDITNPDREDESLYTARSSDNDACFAFNRLRAYETAQETELDHATKDDDEIIIATSKGGSDSIKAAWYYPVMQRSIIRAQRGKNIGRAIGVAGEDEQAVDQLEVTVADPTEEILEYIQRYKEKPLGFLDEEEEEETAGAETQQPSQNGRDEDGPANGRHSEDAESIDEQDAEGDEEE